MSREESLANTELKKGVKYNVTTRHTFEAEFVRFEGDDNEVAVFTTGGVLAKGEPALRKIPTSRLSASEVK